MLELCRVSYFLFFYAERRYIMCRGVEFNPFKADLSLDYRQPGIQIVTRK